MSEKRRILDLALKVEEKVHEKNVKSWLVRKLLGKEILGDIWYITEYAIMLQDKK